MILVKTQQKFWWQFMAKGQCYRDPPLGTRDGCHPWNQHHVLHPHLGHSPWLPCHLPPHCLCPLARKAILLCVHWTIGGDCVKYLGDVSTKTTDIITAKLIFNSMISTPGEWCMIVDLKNFYLGIPMSPADYGTCAYLWLFCPQHHRPLQLAPTHP